MPSLQMAFKELIVPINCLSTSVLRTDGQMAPYNINFYFYATGVMQDFQG